MKPIKPSEVKKKIPDEVISVVNEMINENWDGSTATIYQDALVNRICSTYPTISREDLFSKGLLDFEPLFEKEGWRVEYDKPGYCESYKAHFIFKKKRG